MSPSSLYLFLILLFLLCRSPCLPHSPSSLPLPAPFLPCDSFCTIFTCEMFVWSSTWEGRRRCIYTVFVSRLSVRHEKKGKRAEGGISMGFPIRTRFGFIQRMRRPMCTEHLSTTHIHTRTLDKKEEFQRLDAIALPCSFVSLPPRNKIEASPVTNIVNLWLAREGTQPRRKRHTHLPSPPSPSLPPPPPSP